MRSYLIGLTGGIGSGKSEVAAAFAGVGADLRHADEKAHAHRRRGEAGHPALVETHLLHPLIAARLEDAIGGLTGPYGVLVVPLLLERGGLRKRVARVLVVDCPEAEQLRRVQLRSGLAADDVRKIMATQLPRADRLAAADDVIDNSGPREALGPQVERLDRRYRELAGTARGTR